MAQGLPKTLSPVRVDGYARRHERMSIRTKNEDAIAIAQGTGPSRAALKEKNQAVTDAEIAVEDAFDGWVADDQVVDALVYAVGRKTADYDADHPGSGTREAIFQGLSPSDVTKTNRAMQPNVITKILQRASALPPEHPALPLVPQLTAANDQARLSEAAHTLAVTALTEARAAAEVAKLAVIQKYADNIIDITRAAGEDVAERCFPRVSAPRRKKTDHDGGDDEG